jgi:hypothetical protein
MKREQLSKLIQEYYVDNCVGGTLHIVLDDGNVEGSHIHWCIENSIKEHNDNRALVIAEALLELTEDERQDMYEKDWK